MTPSNYAGPFWESCNSDPQRAYYDALAGILGSVDDDEIRRFHNLASGVLRAAGYQIVERRYVAGLRASVRLLRSEVEHLRAVRNALRAERGRDLTVVVGGDVDIEPGIYRADTSADGFYLTRIEDEEGEG